MGNQAQEEGKRRVSGDTGKAAYILQVGNDWPVRKPEVSIPRCITWWPHQLQVLWSWGSWNQMPIQRPPHYTRQSIIFAPSWRWIRAFQEAWLLLPGSRPAGYPAATSVWFCLLDTTWYPHWTNHLCNTNSLTQPNHLTVQTCLRMKEETAQIIQKHLTMKLTITPHNPHSYQWRIQGG